MSALDAAARESTLDDVTRQIKGNGWVDPQLRGHLDAPGTMLPIQAAGGVALDALEGWLAQNSPQSVRALAPVRKILNAITADAVLGQVAAADMKLQHQRLDWVQGELTAVKNQAGRWKGASGAAVQTAVNNLQSEVEVGSRYAGALSAATGGGGALVAAARAVAWEGVRVAAGALLTWASTNLRSLAAMGAKAVAAAIAAQVSAVVGRLGQTLRGTVKAMLGSFGRLSGLLDRARSALTGGGNGGGSPKPPTGGPQQVDPGQAKQTAHKLYESAVQHEKAVTGQLQNSVEAAGGHLRGLDHRLKTEGSLTRKITDEANVLAANGTPPGQALDRVSGSIKDALRYTVEADTDRYATVRAHAVHELTDAGYSVVKTKNTWAVPGTPGAGPYRGINEFWRTPDGYVFEVQFHTPEGLDVKAINHKLYEEARAAGTAPARIQELQREMIRNSDHIPVPPGALPGH